PGNGKQLVAKSQESAERQDRVLDLAIANIDQHVLDSADIFALVILDVHPGQRAAAIGVDRLHLFGAGVGVLLSRGRLGLSSVAVLCSYGRSKHPANRNNGRSAAK